MQLWLAAEVALSRHPFCSLLLGTAGAHVLVCPVVLCCVVWCCVVCSADVGLSECTQLSNLQALSLKPHLGHQQHLAGPAAAEGSSLLAVSKLTQLRSLAICLPSYSKQLLDGLKLLTQLRVRQQHVACCA
jgi:hypothetical protein